MAGKVIGQFNNLRAVKYFLEFSYFGTKYNGVQRQTPRGFDDFDNTVQMAIEMGLDTLRPVYGGRILVSSRTDAGVHAWHNTAQALLTHPEENQVYSPKLITESVNRYLIDHEHHIRIIRTRMIPFFFNNKHHIISRTYKYRFATFPSSLLPEDSTKEDDNCLSEDLETKSENQKVISSSGYEYVFLLPLSELNRCHILPELDFDKLQNVLNLFNGEHYFISFITVGLDLKRKIYKYFGVSGQRNYTDEIKSIVKESTLRRMHVELKPSNLIYPEHSQIRFWEIHVKARSFMYNQVRRMLGAAFSVALGKVSLEVVKDLLDNGEIGKWNENIALAPSSGLYLANIEYDPSQLILTEDNIENDEEFYFMNFASAHCEHEPHSFFSNKDSELLVEN